MFLEYKTNYVGTLFIHRQEIYFGRQDVHNRSMKETKLHLYDICFVQH